MLFTMSKQPHGVVHGIPAVKDSTLAQCSTKVSQRGWQLSECHPDSGGAEVVRSARFLQPHTSDHHGASRFSGFVRMPQQFQSNYKYLCDAALHDGLSRQVPSGRGRGGGTVGVGAGVPGARAPRPQHDTHVPIGWRCRPSCVGVGNGVVEPPAVYTRRWWLECSGVGTTAVGWCNATPPSRANRGEVSAHKLDV